MTYRCPALILEGPGDEAAVPRFLRDYCARLGIYDFNPLPRPLKNVEIRKLLRAGELERYIQYGSRQDGDSVLLVLDCEDFEPEDVRDQFLARIQSVHGAKPTEIILFKAEFEFIYIPCLPLIAERFPEYEWDKEKLVVAGDCERFRNAKGLISEAMKERAYKETRDQAKFLTAIDYDLLRERSASFRRFEEIFQRFVGHNN